MRMRWEIALREIWNEREENERDQQQELETVVREHSERKVRRGKKR